MWTSSPSPLGEGEQELVYLYNIKINKCGHPLPLQVEKGLGAEVAEIRNKKKHFGQ